MPETEKQITTEAGGKLQPAQGLDSGILDDEDKKAPKIRVIEVPYNGLVVSPPAMAKAIAEGHKTLLVKSKPFDIEDEDYVLVSLRKALGVVTLGKRKELDEEEFAQLEPQHLITEKMREEWSEAQPSWCDGPWYAWPIEAVEKFDVPRDTDAKTGPQVVVKGIAVEGETREEETFKAIWGSPAGKTKIAKRLVAMLHAHSTYVEPFVGSGAVLFEKEPAKTEAINDADPEIAQAFKTLKGLTAPQLAKLKKKSWTGDKGTYATLFKGAFKDAVDKLYRFLYMAHFSYGKLRKGSFNPGAQGTQASMGERVEKLAPRLKNVQVFSGDYEAVIKKFDGPNTMFYLDPPYFGYNVSVGESKFDEEHFFEVLKAIKGKFLITYGIRGKLPGLVRKAKQFYVKVIRPARSIRTMRGVGGPKFLTQLVISNYQVVSKSLEDDGWVIEDWTKADEAATKIENVEEYDPAEAGDKQLRDDFRILLAWYVSWKKDPEGFEHGLETIEKLLRKVIKELVSRGPKVIQFNPRGMKASVRQFFLQVARDVKVPQPMFKALTLAPDTDPDDLTADELVLAHWQLHKLFDKEARSQQGVKGWSTEDIVNLHARVVDKMGKHPPPPDNGLDELSADFETGADKRPKWHEAPVAKAKREFMTINRTGEKRGPKIKLADVLAHFKDFKIRKPYIYLVGGLANHGETEGDIDVLVSDSEKMPQWQKDAIEFRLGRALPSELAERMEVHYDRERGPFTKFVELYDLSLERVNTKNEIKEMRAPARKQEPRAAPPKLKEQAARAARADKLTVGEFFHQPKPTRSALSEQLQTVERLMSLYEEHAEDWLPTSVQKKYDGANHQIHKNGETVRIFSEDGDDNTDRLPGVVEEVQALDPDKLVMVAEIEKWDGSQHLPREAVAGYLSSKEDADDSDLVANVYDVLWNDDGDIHKKSTSDRLEALGGLGIEQSTMGAPSLKHRLNAAPSVKADDLEELERAVQKIRKLPGSEGVVNKQVDAPYPLKPTTPDTWVKFHNATTIRGLVIGRAKTKGSVWVYQYGVLPGKEEAQETVKVGDKKAVPVGDTFATKRDFSAGDGILVEAETVNLERSPKGVKLTAWVPRVMGELNQKADTVDAVAARAKSNLVLQEKTVDEAGEVTYKPTGKAEKQADPYLEVPPDEKTYKYSVQHHWRGKSKHSDVRIELRPGQLLLGWTMNTQIKGVVKEPVTTLTEAQKWSSESNMNKISKVNWNTGEWATRPKAGTDKLVRAEILSERKAPEPHAWLDVEGKTKDPEPGKAPPVGGTRQFPGVFDIVDQGTVEYGAQKPWVHEYFFHGGGLNYRMFFRLLKVSKREEAGDCEACGSTEATVDMGWADAKPGAFCTECSSEFLAKADVVLPPSEEQPLPDGLAWLAIYPDDQQPNVLDPETVKKGWMPPDGRSALPAGIRSQIPSKFHYWRKKGAAARSLRDDLVEAIKAKEVKIDYEAPYKKAEKASLLDADFVLQEQTWRGPIQVRVGPTRTKWWVRLDIGRKELLVLELQRNPLDNKTVTARLSQDKHKDSMNLSGGIKPGHYLNPTKETPSNIEALDAGKAEVLALTKDFVKIRFTGKKLKGLFGIKRNNAEWLWSPTDAAPKVKVTEKKIEFEMYIPFDRVEIQKGKDGKEKRLVTGIVLEPNEVDAQNDWEKAETIERAAFRFLANYNLPPDDGGTQLGVMHKTFGDIGIELVESYIAPVAFKLGKKKVKKGSWVVTVHVSSDKRWKEVKSGKLGGFSVGGVATVAGG